MLELHRPIYLDFFLSIFPISYLHERDIRDSVVD